jgi:hypothetical protein
MQWQDKVRLMRETLKATVKFSDTQFKDYFEFQLVETDTFHPFDTDAALNTMEEHDLFEMFCDVEDIIREHFDDAWNFPPGYVKPEGIEFEPGEALDIFLKKTAEFVA